VLPRHPPSATLVDDPKIASATSASIASIASIDPLDVIHH
jgi:hypothetical protein